MLASDLINLFFDSGVKRHWGPFIWTPFVILVCLWKHNFLKVVPFPSTSEKDNTSHCVRLLGKATLIKL